MIPVRFITTAAMTIKYTCTLRIMNIEERDYLPLMREFTAPSAESGVPMSLRSPKAA